MNASERKDLTSCECGYHPEKYNDNCDKYGNPVCSVTKALRNHVIFASFANLFDENDPSEYYYDLSGYMGKLRCNWVFLAEIDESFFFLRHRVHAHSRFGEKVPIHFYNESNEMPVSFTWQDLKKGHTLAILYAERKTFLDLSEGIRQEALETCYVFKTGLKNLEEEASKVLDLKDLNFKKSPEKCFSCGVEKESLLRCAKCKLAVYCSKECQVKSWQSVHKNLCSQMDVLLRLASLPRNRKFKKYLSFCPGQDFLPEYVYSERHVQKPLKSK